MIFAATAASAPHTVLDVDAEERRRRVREWLAARPTKPSSALVQRVGELRVFEPADLDAVSFTRRRLPHWTLPGSTYFVTFRFAPWLRRTLFSLAENRPTAC